MSLAVGACNEPAVTTSSQEGSDGGVPGIANLRSIRVEPQSLSLTIDGETAQSQRYQAIGEFADGHTEDITDRVTWTISPASLGRFRDVSTLQTAGFGGQGTVFARSGTLLGTATVFVRISRRIVEADARGSDETVFRGPADAQIPVVLYPYDHVLLPPNLGTLDIQWLRGNSANVVFEVSLQNRVTDLRVYTGCRQVGSGCSYELGRTLWNQMAYSNLGNTDPVVITVRGTAGPGRPVGTSRPIHLKFALEDLRGGIYYWTAEQGVSGIYRIDLEKGRVEPYYLTTDAPRDHRGQQYCVGCHAISHAGDRLSLVLGGAHISDLVQLDVESRMRTLTRIDTTPGRPEVQRQFSNFQAYSADGNHFVSALRGKLRLVSALTGNDVIANIPTGGNATHPDWGRSGTYLVFTRYSDTHPTNIPNTEGDNTEIFIARGAIARMRWNGNAFEQLQVLVPERPGQNSYYPAVAPNDQYVVFNRVSGCRENNVLGECTAYDNPRARIMMVPISGGGEIDLVNINKRGPTDTRDDLTNSWPKFSPFRQAAPQGRTVMWLTFSSKRNYGLRLPNNTDRPQLWMAAITVGGEPTGGDPSSPPFWIPYQNLQTHNHIAQWTEQVIPILK
ncbi:MAG: hypothetical protein RMK29_07665 [Myxococcales bacterium]|nr:hypothetical protein [Myxococcales bacterium]